MVFPQDANEEPATQPSFSDHRSPPVPPVALDFFAEQRRTVLIVDQSPMVRAMIQSILSKEQIVCLGVENALNALVSIAKHCPQLILLATQLPRLDGYRTCQIIRKNLQCVSIPVIMLGRQEESSSVMQGHLAGSTDFLLKPFRPHQLLQMVKKYLPM